MQVNSAVGPADLSQVGLGQVGLVRSWPYPIISLVGMCFNNKKEFFQQKFEEECLIL